MKTLLLSCSVALALATASAPLLAQQPPAQEKEEIATVREPTGEIKTSDGGEFTTANEGRRLKEDYRIMVGENSRVTVEYDNGCDRVYDEPGVYELERDCIIAYVDSGGGFLKVAAGTALGAVILAQQDDVKYVPPPPPPPPPVSR